MNLVEALKEWQKEFEAAELAAGREGYPERGLLRKSGCGPWFRFGAKARVFIRESLR